MELAFKKQGFIIYKLIPCLIITMFAFMCLYGSSVYATDITINDTIVNIDNRFSDYKNMVILLGHMGNNSYYYLYCTNEDIVYKEYSNGYKALVNSLDNSGIWDRWITSSSDISSLSSLDFSSSSSNKTCTFGSGSIFSVNSIKFSKLDIINANDNSLLFQGAPQEQQTTQGTTILVPIVEQQEMKPLQEILGILPVVIVVLVGLIAIRKAIQFLMARMKKA